MSKETVFVEVLTDEELSVIAPPGGIAVSPYLGALEPHEQHIARRTAYRSLLARGIVDPPSAEAVAAAAAAGDGSVDLPVRRDVRSVVTLRETARTVVALARSTMFTCDYWYAHVVDEIVLLEEVGSDGMHRFALAREEQLLDLVVAAAVHPVCGDAAGPPVDVPETDDPAPPDPIAARLGPDWLRADLVVRTVGERRIDRVGLFTGPGGGWLVAHHDGVAPQAEPMTAAALTERVRRLVRCDNAWDPDREGRHVRT